MLKLNHSIHTESAFCLLGLKPAQASKLCVAFEVCIHVHVKGKYFQGGGNSGLPKIEGGVSEI